MFTYLLPYSSPLPHPFSPSLISLTVSVDVKHHVHLLSPSDTFDVYTHAKERNSLLMYGAKKTPRHCSVCYKKCCSHWPKRVTLDTAMARVSLRLCCVTALYRGFAMSVRNTAASAFTPDDTVLNTVNR